MGLLGASHISWDFSTWMLLWALGREYLERAQLWASTN